MKAGEPDPFFLSLSLSVSLSFRTIEDAARKKDPTDEPRSESHRETVENNSMRGTALERFYDVIA